MLDPTAEEPSQNVRLLSLPERLHTLFDLWKAESRTIEAAARKRTFVIEVFDCLEAMKRVEDIINLRPNHRLLCMLLDQLVLAVRQNRGWQIGAFLAANKILSKLVELYYKAGTTEGSVDGSITNVRIDQPPAKDNHLNHKYLLAYSIQANYPALSR